MKNHLERIILGICSVSLSVNAWLISNKLDHIDDSIQGLRLKVGAVAEDLAATKAEVSLHTTYITYLQQELLHTKGH